MKNAAMRPQGTSSMGYPKKNFRIYTQKLDNTVLEVNGTVVKWGYMKVADSIDFDITKVTHMSRYGNDGYNLTNIPVAIINEYGNAFDIISYTDDDYYWGDFVFPKYGYGVFKHCKKLLKTLICRLK